MRMWAKKRQWELRYSNDSPENLFAAMMLFLLPFGEKDLEDKPQSLPFWKNFWKNIDASEHYSGDATLFELGCYMYFRLDLWLYQHKPHRREEFSRAFADRFIELFTQALRSRDIPALFNQRISQYAELARTDADGEKYHFHLDQLILRTKDNKLPESYDFKHDGVVIIDAFEHMGLKLALAAWEKGMIPALLKSVESICNLQAIKIKSDDVVAHYIRGLAYGSLGRYEEATEACKQAIKIKPDDADAHCGLGNAYSDLGRYQEAIESYKQAIRIKPDYAEAHCNLGVAYGKLGRYQDAIESFKQVIIINSDYAEAHYNLGVAYFFADDKGSALEEYKILKTLDAEKASELFNIIYK